MFKAIILLISLASAVPSHGYSANHQSTMQDHHSAAYMSLDRSSTSARPDHNSTEHTVLHNPETSTSDHLYKSLEISDQDLGPDEYADPDKYTEPPDLPDRNSKITGDRDSYVSQGITENITAENKRDCLILEPPTEFKDSVKLEISDNNIYFTLEPDKPSDNYILCSSSNKINLASAE